MCPYRSDECILSFCDACDCMYRRTDARPRRCSDIDFEFDIIRIHLANDVSRKEFSENWRNEKIVKCEEQWSHSIMRLSHSVWFLIEWGFALAMMAVAWHETMFIGLFITKWIRHSCPTPGYEICKWNGIFIVSVSAVSDPHCHWMMRTLFRWTHIESSIDY